MRHDDELVAEVLAMRIRTRGGHSLLDRICRYRARDRSRIPFMHLYAKRIRSVPNPLQLLGEGEWESFTLLIVRTWVSRRRQGPA